MYDKTLHQLINRSVFNEVNQQWEILLISLKFEKFNPLLKMIPDPEKPLWWTAVCLEIVIAY